MRRQPNETIPDEPVWVKFSTDFKKELASLDGYALKVFLYIGLSVNFDNGTAYPGVRNIAENTGMNKDTVTKVIEKLEKLGLLTVERREGARTIYKPVQYLSVGTVRPDRTPETKPSEQTGQPEQNCPTEPDTRNKTVRPDRTPETKPSDRTGQPDENCPTQPDTRNTTVRTDRTPEIKLSDESLELSDESLELSGAQEGNLHNKNNKIKQEDDDDDETKIAAKLKNLANLYETTIGAITPLMADLLRNAAIDYPEEWFEPAFEVAVKNNARRWIYVETILDGWKRNGFGWKPANASPSRSQQRYSLSFTPRRGKNGEDQPRYKIPEYSEADLAIIDEIDRLSDL